MGRTREAKRPPSRGRCSEQEIAEEPKKWIDGLVRVVKVDKNSAHDSVLERQVQQALLFNRDI